MHFYNEIPVLILLDHRIYIIALHFVDKIRQNT